MRFGTIVADPPWSFDDKLTMSDIPRGADDQYDTLFAPTISSLPVRELAADNAILGIWCPSCLIEEGLATVACWGFQFKQIWTWVKTKQDGSGLAMGMGHLARNCSEHMLVGTKGKILSELAVRNQRNVFMHPATRHSVKPETVQTALETMFPTHRRLELFARRDRSNWTCVGNECPSTLTEDVRSSIKRLKLLP